jgi:urease accessory protein
MAEQNTPMAAPASVNTQTSSPANSPLIRIEQLPQLTPDKLAALLASRVVVPLPMTCADRRRLRRRLLAADGLELGLALPTGTLLAPGQLLYASPSHAYMVEAALEPVAVIYPRHLAEVAQIAHAIGNLHRDLQVVEHHRAIELLALWDAPLELLLLRLGVAFEQTKRPFLGRPSWEH